MPLALADGQLAAASATILGAASGERTVGLTLFNTSASAQAVTFAVTRVGSTARTVARIKLEKKYESAYINGLPLDPSDLLAGYATYATSVDYLIHQQLAGTPFEIIVRDENGFPKASAEIEITTTENFGLTRDGIVISGLLEEVRDLLAKIA